MSRVEGAGIQPPLQDRLWHGRPARAGDDLTWVMADTAMTRTSVSPVWSSDFSLPEQCSLSVCPRPDHDQTRPLCACAH